jgi:hypothetical protein
MDYYNKYLKYKYKFLELKNQLGGNHPKGTLFLYKYSENNVWSAILLYIKSNGEYVIEFDGIVVPDTYKDGSIAGPENKIIMDILDKSNLTVRLPEETDDEKRKAWSEKRQAYQKEMTRKLIEADDVLFKSFHIGESVTYIETTYHSFGRGIEQWDKDITSTIVNMNRADMTVELENKSIISIHSLKKLK